MSRPLPITLSRFLLTVSSFLLLLLPYETSGDADIKPESDLLNVLQKAAGVYKDPKKNPALDKTVIITGCNFGYVNHLHNLKCFMDRLELKALVLSMDERLHVYVQERMNSSTAGSLFYSYNIGGVGQTAVKEEATTFRSPQFHIITNRKKEGVVSVMELGYDALFVDTDIALLRDPFPYLIWKNVDYAFSHNKICPQAYDWDFYKSEEEGNTGFYFVRSNSRTIKLWKDALATAPKYPDLDDQSIFWMQIRSSVDPPIIPIKKCGDYSNSSLTGRELVVCPLDGCMFSAGALRGIAFDWLKGNLKQRKFQCVSVHANYMKGNEKKRDTLNKFGLWLAEKDHHAKKGVEQYTDGKCKKFVPTY